MDQPVVNIGETITAHEPAYAGADGEFTIYEMDVVDGTLILQGDFKPADGYGHDMPGVFAAWDPGDANDDGACWQVCEELETITG
jgi:hypothetical protein